MYSRLECVERRDEQFSSKRYQMSEAHFRSADILVKQHQSAAQIARLSISPTLAPREKAGPLAPGVDVERS